MTAVSCVSLPAYQYPAYQYCVSQRFLLDDPLVSATVGKTPLVRVLLSIGVQGSRSVTLLLLGALF